MNIRPATLKDLADLEDIDGTIESTEYLHVDHNDKDEIPSWKLEWRPTREKLTLASPIDEDTLFTLRQVLSGADDGITLTAEHDDRPVALVFAQPDGGRGVMNVLDFRVDSDVRRQGIATVLLFQLIERAKDADLRAAYVTTRTNNAPAAKLLQKLGWVMAGIDTKRHSNHDLVKEAATLMWYYEIK